MKKDSLTPEEHQQMLAYRQEYLTHMLTRNGKINEADFEEGIAWVYQKYLGKPKPQIMYADSWLAAVIQIQIVKDALKKGRANLRDNLGANLRDNLGANLRDNLGANLWANLGANLGANLWDNLGANLWDNLWDNLGANLRDNLGDNLYSTFSEHSLYVRIDDAGWTAFYDFGMRVTNQRNHPLCQDLQRYIKLIRAGAFVTYLYDGLVVAVRPPVHIHRNASGRLHCTTGPAVVFPDGESYFYVNGRSVPRDIIDNPEQITRKRFLSERNAEIKGAIYEVLGQRKMFDLLGAELVDQQTIHHQNGDIETVTLYKTRETFPEIDNEPFAWVKMVCPSTGTNYLAGVEPHHTNAREAIASLSRFTAQEYSFTDRT